MECCQSGPPAANDGFAGLTRARKARPRTGLTDARALRRHVPPPTCSRAVVVLEVGPAERRT